MANIIINGEPIGTSGYTTYAGATLQGTFQSEDFNEFNSITGKYVERYSISNAAKGSGFNFTIQLGRNFSADATDTVTITYFDFDSNVKQATVLLISDNDNKQPQLYWTKGGTEYYLSVSSASTAMAVMCERKNMDAVEGRVTSDSWWVDPSFGNLDQTQVNLAITANNQTTVQRLATVTVRQKDKDGNDHFLYLYLSQEGGPKQITSTLKVATTPLTFDYKGEGIVTLSIQQSNLVTDSLQVTSSNDWIKKTYTALLNTLEIQCDRYTGSPLSRYGYVTITAQGYDDVNYNYRIDVTQTGDDTQLLIPDKTEYTLGYLKGDEAKIHYTLHNMPQDSVYAVVNDLYLPFIKYSLDKANQVLTITNLNTIDTVEGDDYTVYLNDVAITITQTGAPDYEEYPIWQDWEENIPIRNYKYVDYKYVDADTDEVYFSGRAIVMNEQFAIHPSYILRNVIKEKLSIYSTEPQDNNYYVNACLQYSVDEGETWELWKIYRVYNDWSYKHNYNNAFASDPILDYLDYRQWFIFSFKSLFGDLSPYFDCIYEEDNQTIDSLRVQDQMKTIISQNLKSIHNDVAVTYIKDSKPITRTFNVRCTNSDYAVYFKNSMGGFDSMLFSSASSEQGTITDNEYTSMAQNLSGQFQNTQFQKDIQRFWQLKTCWLNDAQSAKMKGLLTSTMAWLHNLNDNTIIPINMKDSSYQIKTRKNQGNKVYNYTIKVNDSFKRFVK